MWNKYTIEKDKVYYWKNGKVEFWVKKEDKRWQVAFKNSSEIGEDVIVNKVVETPENLDWHTCIGDKNNILNITPALPSRPIVVKPLQSYKLLPETSSQLFVHVPVSIQLYAGTVKEENLIIEIPYEVLSNTWFGAPDNGELAFAVKNNFYSDLNVNSLHKYEVLCPVKITNDHDTALDFQRLLIHVEYVAIYIHQGKLYSNEIKVKFKGENTVSDISYGHQAPGFLEGAKQVASSRNPDRNNVLKKSFYFIKSLTEY